MLRNKWAVWAAAGLMVMALGSGCKSKKAKAGAGDGSIPGIGMDGLENAEGMSGDRFAGQEQRGQFEMVYFDYDSSQVRESERMKVERVAEFMKSKASQSLIVEGHCDERGSNEYNLALGERRALAVRAYLIGLGVDGERIQTKSFGEERPAAMGHDESSWSQNRRAEFVTIQ